MPAAQVSPPDEAAGLTSFNGAFTGNSPGV
jgi:hypothetical protein